MDVRWSDSTLPDEALDCDDLNVREPAIGADPYALTLEIPVVAEMERLLKTESKTHVKFLQARAFAEALVASDGGKASKAELRRRFKQPIGKLMEKPEVQTELKRVLSTWAWSAEERKAFLKAKTNQLAMAPDTVPNADQVMRALKLMGDQEAAADQPVAKKIEINFPAELTVPVPAMLPQAEVIEVKDLTPAKETT